MTTHDAIKTALGNLGRHPIRTILSSVGVTVGILTIVTMLSLGIGVHREFIQTFESAGLETLRIRPVTEERGPFDLFTEPERKVLITPSLVEEIRARDDVIEAFPQMYTSGSMNVSLQIDDEMLRVRVGESYLGLSDPFTQPPRLVAGKELDKDAQGEIVISASALEAMGYEGQQALEDAIGQQVALVIKAPRGDTATFDLKVAGVLETSYGSEAGYFGTHIAVADALAINQWWYNDPDLLANRGYDMLTIKAATLNDAVEIVEQLEERGFKVDSLQQMLDSINKAMILVKTMLGSVGGLALLVASIGIANTMVMAVYERTREIGILKAVGASPGDVRALFVVEASMIGLLGGIAGTIVGWLLGLGLNELILAILRWQEIPVQGTFFVVPPWLVLLALGFATVVGLLAGLYPAARAARLDPLEALRYE